MIIESIEQENTNTFTPDPLLDTGSWYEARIVGIHVTGKVQKDVFKNKVKTGEFKDEDEVLIFFQLTEDSTKVERGDEMKQRYPFVKFMNYNSHELSGFHKLAAMCNKDAAWIKGDKGYVDATQMIGRCVMIKLVTNAKGDKQNIAKDGICMIADKYLDRVEEAEMPYFCFDRDSGAHAGTSIEDVQAWALKRSLAVTVEDVGQMAQIDAELTRREEVKAQGNNGTLDSDAKPADKPAPKTAPKADAPAKESRAERKAAKAAAAAAAADSKDDNSHTVDTLSEEEAEDLLLDSGVEEDALDALDNGEEGAYHAAVVAECNKLGL